MKIGKNHIGETFSRTEDSNQWVKILALSPDEKSAWIIDRNGNYGTLPCSYIEENFESIKTNIGPSSSFKEFSKLQEKLLKTFHEIEPKKRIEAAPAVYRSSTGIYISNNIFNNTAEAIYAMADTTIKVITWPAKFDAEKGVWYWDED